MARSDKLLSVLLAVLVIVAVVVLAAQARAPSPSAEMTSEDSTIGSSTTQTVASWLHRYARAVNLVMSLIFRRNDDEWNSGDAADRPIMMAGSEAQQQRLAIMRHLRAQLTGQQGRAVDPAPLPSSTRQGIQAAQKTLDGNEDIRIAKLRNREREIKMFMESYDLALDLSDAQIRNWAMDPETRAYSLSEMAQTADTFCNPGFYLKYSQIKYTCNDTEVTQAEYTVLSLNSANNCSSENAIARSCLCPDDRTGKRCENVRSLECSAALVSPVKDCIVPDSGHGNLRLDGDFSCLRFTKQDVVDFAFNLTCNFTAPLNNNEQNLNPNITYTIIGLEGNNYTLAQVKAMFVYYAQSDHFKLTYQLWRPFELKFFDLNVITDDRNLWSLDPTPEQWTSAALIEFRGINLSSIAKNRQFITGGRLYAEAGWRYTWAYVGFLTMRTERIFIDLTDEVEPRRIFNDKNIRTALYISVPTLIAIAVGIVGAAYLLYQLYKRHQRIKEELANSLTSQSVHGWQSMRKESDVIEDNDEDEQ